MNMLEPKDANVPKENEINCEKAYKKRRYLCPGKRRYKAKSKKRCCKGKYNRNKINLCNRNWSRISIDPFINFLRVFRRRFSPNTPIETIAARAMCKWKKLSRAEKKCYLEQAKRARCRGFRT